MDLDDPVCLVQSDAIRRGGRGREDVDHRAKQSVLARFIDPLIRRDSLSVQFRTDFADFRLGFPYTYFTFCKIWIACDEFCSL
ncbi:MAG: hypothetical protein EOP20_12765 [Hyphomicrobiales bacterium]|nr:MAG: hypothetical protein EOP20_12765 [Hyphomicrobiales bacterium]